MINSIVKLKDLCELLISMGFSESTNEQEIKEVIASLEKLIEKEVELLRERESMP
jgi:hypothetical protein